VAWLQSAAFGHRRQIGIHIAVVAMAVAGSISELLARLLYIGITSAEEWLAKDFNLNNWSDFLFRQTNAIYDDGNGWRTLEMMSIASHGMLLWVDTIELVFFFGVTTFLYISVHKSQARWFKLNWARLGALIGVLSIVEFVFVILRYQNWNAYGRVEKSVTRVNDFVLSPIWLLWLARQLPKAEFAQEENKMNEELNLRESIDSTTTSDGSPVQSEHGGGEGLI